MKIADNVALILSRYGFSLAEGLEIYAKMKQVNKKSLCTWATIQIVWCI